MVLDVEIAVGDHRSPPVPAPTPDDVHTCDVEGVRSSHDGADIEVVLPVLDCDMQRMPPGVEIGNDRRHIVTERAIEGSPTLVIEILSPTTHRTDRVTKAQLYAKHNVPHYWLIDPDQRTLEAYELVTDHYDLVAGARDAEVFTPSLFPGFSIRLADLWA